MLVKSAWIHVDIDASLVKDSGSLRHHIDLVSSLDQLIVEDGQGCGFTTARSSSQAHPVDGVILWSDLFLEDLTTRQGT